MNKLLNNNISPEISIVMPAYNAQDYIREAIDSIIGQSFTNFECIIVDDGSTDNTRDIIQSYDDKRIILLENEHDFIGSLNWGLRESKGRYIARMDTDDVMQPDRLKIQYAIMEQEPSITVCGTWMSPFGKRITKGAVVRSFSGQIENPLLLLLKDNIIFHPTAMIRAKFIKDNNLNYEYYDYAEDYKLWLEIAKKGGLFYVESQLLLFYRVSEHQVSTFKKEEQIETSDRIRKEVLDFIIKSSDYKGSSYEAIYSVMKLAKQENIMEDEDIFRFFYNIFQKNRVL